MHPKTLGKKGKPKKDDDTELDEGEELWGCDTRTGDAGEAEKRDGKGDSKGEGS